MTSFGEGTIAATDVAWTSDSRLLVASGPSPLFPSGCGPECGLYFYEETRSGLLAPVGPMSSLDVSPSSGELVYVGLDDASRPALYSMSDARSEPEAVAIGSSELEPRDVAWSPDGSRIALTMYNGSDDDLYLYDIEPRAFTPLLTGNSWDSSPAWAGNDLLLFSSDRDGTRQIWQLKVDAEEPTQLTHDDRYLYFAAAWRP